MSNELTGRVLTVGQTQQLPGREGRTFLKREITIDCTRHDPWTGERSKYENTPQLEFTGEICRELDYIQPGDVVTIAFEVEGRRYTGRDQEPRIYTRVRPYKIEKRQQPQDSQPAPVQQPTPTSLFGDEPPF